MVTDLRKMTLLVSNVNNDSICPRSAVTELFSNHDPIFMIFVIKIIYCMQSIVLIDNLAVFYVYSTKFCDPFYLRYTNIVLLKGGTNIRLVNSFHFFYNFLVSEKKKVY